MKTALITGITGQDGSYLAQLLLAKGYRVVGMVSQKHSIGDENIAAFRDQLTLETGDLLDSRSLQRILTSHQPQEVYNLAGITFIPASWDQPALTFDINALGVARLLEEIRGRSPHTRFFQASSAKIFGNPETSPQNEATPIRPLDPYSTSKAAAHHLVGQFRDHFGLFAASGIMYNHESERRGDQFVTKKITLAAAAIKLGRQSRLELGDLEAKQDWGYAPDYVEAMWRMLQQDTPQDFIIATGVHHTVKDICRIAFAEVGLDYTDYVDTDQTLFRQEPVTPPLGDASKAKQLLGWQPQVSFEDMIRRMVRFDLNTITK